MVSVAENFPVCYMNGTDKLSPSCDKRASAVSSISSYYGETRISTAGDSDIDAVSTINTIHIDARRTLKPKLEISTTEKDESLVQWLMTQLEQKGLSGSAAPPVVASHRNVRPCEQLSASSPRLPVIVDRKPDSYKPTLVQSCGRLSKPRTAEHYYPRLPRSSEHSKESLLDITGGSSANDPKDSINKMLSTLKEKTLGIQQKNDDITAQLDRAVNIIQNWKGKPVNGSSIGNHATSKTIRNKQYCSESPCANAYSPLFLNKLYSRPMPTVKSEIHPARAERAQSATPSPRISTPIPPRVQHSRENSAYLGVHNFNDIRIKPTLSNDHLRRSKHGERATENVQLSVRRYSTIQDKCIQRFDHQFADITSLEDNKSSLRNQDTLPRLPKHSRFCRAVSQTPTVGREVSPNDRRGTSDVDSTKSSQTTIHSQSSSSAAKRITGFILRHFGRRKESPCESPTGSHNGSPFGHADRCISLGELIDINKENSSGKMPKKNQEVNSLNDSFESCEAGMQSEELFRRGENRHNHIN